MANFYPEIDNSDDEDTETCVGCNREVPYDDVEETTSGYMCKDCIQTLSEA